MSAGRVRRAMALMALPLVLGLLLGAGEAPAGRASGEAARRADGQAAASAAPTQALVDPSAVNLLGSPQRLISTAQASLLIGVVSLAPAALLMVTAFVRISIVLALLRQAIGSPQVPGNQVMSA